MSKRNIHAGIPFDDDDATIAAALEDVSIPTLVLSMVDYWGWTREPKLEEYVLN